MKVHKLSEEVSKVVKEKEKFSNEEDGSKDRFVKVEKVEEKSKIVNGLTYWRAKHFKNIACIHYDMEEIDEDKIEDSWINEQDILSAASGLQIDMLKYKRKYGFKYEDQDFVLKALFKLEHELKPVETWVAKIDFMIETVVSKVLAYRTSEFQVYQNM